MMSDKPPPYQSPQGYAAPQQGYAAPQQGYAPSQHVPPPQGYATPPQGCGQQDFYPDNFQHVLNAHQAYASPPRVHAPGMHSSHRMKFRLHQIGRRGRGKGSTCCGNAGSRKICRQDLAEPVDQPDFLALGHCMADHVCF
eukprot:XP_011414566.1 PREDICTED: annexin A7 isoform X2 [Crassostrea gigas]